MPGGWDVRNVYRGDPVEGTFNHTRKTQPPAAEPVWRLGPGVW